MLVGSFAKGVLYSNIRLDVSLSSLRADQSGNVKGRINLNLETEGYEALCLG